MGWTMLRQALVTAALFAGATALSREIAAPSWPIWLGAVAATIGIASALALTLGPAAEERRAVIARMRAMVTGLRGKLP
jgi:hypothetical protein